MAATWTDNVFFEFFFSLFWSVQQPMQPTGLSVRVQRPDTWNITIATIYLLTQFFYCFSWFAIATICSIDDRRVLKMALMVVCLCCSMQTLTYPNVIQKFSFQCLIFHDSTNVFRTDATTITNYYYY